MLNGVNSAVQNSVFNYFFFSVSVLQLRPERGLGRSLLLEMSSNSSKYNSVAMVREIASWIVFIERKVLLLQIKVVHLTGRQDDAAYAKHRDSNRGEPSAPHGCLDQQPSHLR